MKRSVKAAIKLLFVLYILLMLWLLFGQRIGLTFPETYREQFLLNCNLRPFQTISHYLWLLRHVENPALLQHSFVNLSGNIVMFIPLGFFLPALFPRCRAFLRQLLFCASIILTVELLQLFTLLGSCDVDDLLLNLIGTSIGYGFFRLMFREKAHPPE